MVKDPALLELIAKAIDAWPQITYKGGRNSRAHAAALLIEAGRVHHVNCSRYQVDGKRCDADLDRCECKDHEHGAPWYPVVGKLCKHRLAARMYRNWAGYKDQTLADFLTQFLSTRGATLIVEWTYDTGRLQVVGYVHNRQRMRWPGNRGIPFTWQQLKFELGQIDWGLSAIPQKGSGNSYEYFYEIAPGPGIPITEHLLSIRGYNNVMVGRADNRRLTAIFNGQMERNVSNG